MSVLEYQRTILADTVRNEALARAIKARSPKIAALAELLGKPLAP